MNEQNKGIATLILIDKDWLLFAGHGARAIRCTATRFGCVDRENRRAPWFSLSLSSTIAFNVLVFVAQ